MPRIEAYYIKAIGRSTEVLREFRNTTPKGADDEKKRLEKLHPKCTVIIIKKREFVVKIEKNLKLPKKRIPLGNKGDSSDFSFIF